MLQLKARNNYILDKKARNNAIYTFGFLAAHNTAKKVIQFLIKGTKRLGFILIFFLNQYYVKE